METILEKTEWEHIKLIDYKLMKCENCTDEAKFPSRAMSLHNHIATMVGFIALHRDCKKGDKKLFSI